MSKKERIALERMKSLSNQLVLSKAEAGVGTARMGQFLEQIIAKSKANETMTPESIKFFRDQSKNIFEDLFGDANISRKKLDNIVASSEKYKTLMFLLDRKSVNIQNI